VLPNRVPFYPQSQDFNPRKRVKDRPGPFACARGGQPCCGAETSSPSRTAPARRRQRRNMPPGRAPIRGNDARAMGEVRGGLRAHNPTRSNSPRSPMLATRPGGTQSCALQARVELNANNGGRRPAHHRHKVSGENWLRRGDHPLFPPRSYPRCRATISA
jgi:hypothetical protein